MSDNINDMDFEQLMAQRNQTLKSTLQENDSSEGSVDPETLALSEINYITDFFKTTGAEGLAGKLAQLRALLNGREFTTERGKEAIQKEKQKVVRSYQSTLSKSQESVSKLSSLRFLFLLLGLIFLAPAAFCLLGGLIIPGIIILVISLFFFGKRTEFKEDIQSIQEAKKQIENAKKIAKVENSEIIFLDSEVV